MNPTIRLVCRVLLFVLALAIVVIGFVSYHKFWYQTNDHFTGVGTTHYGLVEYVTGKNGTHIWKESHTNRDHLFDLFQTTRGLVITVIIFGILFLLNCTLLLASPVVPTSFATFGAHPASRLFHVITILWAVLLVIFSAIAVFHFSNALPSKWDADGHHSGNGPWKSWIGETASPSFFSWGPDEGWYRMRANFVLCLVALFSSLAAMVFHDREEYDYNRV